MYSDQTYANKVTLAFSRPGKPTDNAYIEPFNGSLREECLNVHWFEDLTDARAKTQVWKQEYNEDRPHRSLNTWRPSSTKRKGTHKGQKPADPVDQQSGSLQVCQKSPPLWLSFWGDPHSTSFCLTIDFGGTLFYNNSFSSTQLECQRWSANTAPRQLGVRGVTVCS